MEQLVPCPSPARSIPYGLWSLWDMLEREAGPFFKQFKHVSTAGQMLNTLIGSGQNPAIDARSWAELRGDVVALKEMATRMGLGGTEAIATDTLREMDAIAPDASGNIVLDTKRNLFRVQSGLQRITDVGIAEARGRWFLALSPAEATLWRQPEPAWGQDFHDKFLAARFDLEEAGKCLALERGTACAFHLVRILETGLRAVRTCLGVNDPLVGNERNWGTILRRVREEGIAPRGKSWQKGPCSTKSMLC